MEPRVEPVLRDAVSRAVVQDPAEGAPVSRKRSSIGNRTCCPLNGLYLFPSCTVNARFAALSLSYPSRSSSSGQTRASAFQRAIHAAARTVPFLSSSFASPVFSYEAWIRGIEPSRLDPLHDFRSSMPIVNRSTLLDPRVDSCSIGLLSLNLRSFSLKKKKKVKMVNVFVQNFSASFYSMQKYKTHRNRHFIYSFGLNQK